MSKNSAATFRISRRGHVCSHSKPIARDEVRIARDSHFYRTREGVRKMQLTYSATKPEEILPFEKHFVESSREVSADAADAVIAAVGLPAAETPDPVNEASVSMSVVG